MSRPVPRRPFRPRSLTKATSQIPLQLNRKDHEGLIERHGQLTRWVQAMTCPCQTTVGDRAINCPNKCQDGHLLSFPGNINHINELVNHRGFVGEIKEDGLKSVSRIERQDARRAQTFSATSILSDKTFRFEGQSEPSVSDLMVADYVTDPRLQFDECGQFYQGGGVVRVDPLEILVATGGEVSSEIVTVTEIRNVTKNQTLTSLNTARNLVFIDIITNEPDINDFIVVRGTHIKPFTFAFTDAESQEVYEPSLRSISGQAVMSVPFRYDMVEGDLVTPLLQEQIVSHVTNRGPGITDKVPVFELLRIIKIIDSAGTEFIQNTDFALFGRNEIKWLVGGNAPTLDAKYSILMGYRPSYKVFIDKSTIRTSENERFPKRFMLKQFERLNQSEEVI